MTHPINEGADRRVATAWEAVAAHARALSDRISLLEADDAPARRIAPVRAQLAALMEGQAEPEANILRNTYWPGGTPAAPIAAQTAPADTASVLPAPDTPSGAEAEGAQPRRLAKEAPSSGMRVSLAGRLAAEPTFGVADSGRSWVRLRVASNERLRDPDGTWRDAPPVYTEVVLFGPAAENLANMMHTGDPVLVKGRPEVETFTRRDGTPGAAIKVFASSVAPRLVEPRQIGGSPDRAADQHPAEQMPTLHHNQQHTIAVGVGRANTDVQAALKQAGFRWSAQRTAWFLPAGMDFAARGERVDRVLGALEPAGPGNAILPIALSTDPAPAARAAAPVARSAGAFGPEPEAARPDRSLSR